MIHFKSDQEIQIMKEGGKILKQTLNQLLEMSRVGVSLKDIDQKAEEIIRSYGAEPAFKKVRNYYWTCCFSLNDGVVHGIPTDYRLQNGDKIGIDCGVYYKGFNTDSAWSILVGDKAKDKKWPEKEKFLKTGEKALIQAVKEVKIGNRIGHISKAIQDSVEVDGYSVVRGLTGHGVGRKLHEAPEIPGILLEAIDGTPQIEKGMVLAVEVIYNMGKPDIVYKGDDGWTIAAEDGKISGLFEKTVAVASDGVFLLT